MIDNQEEISLAEFKAWLAGLIRGKRGALPDLDDWKAIKETLDKIVPDVEPIVGGPTMPVPIIIREIVKEPYQPEQVPYINPYQPIWITEPNTSWPKIGDMCGEVNIPGAGDDRTGGAGYFPQGQAVCGSFPQEQAMCGGASVAAAGTIGDVGTGVSGCSTIKIDNSAMSPTFVKESGDTFTTSHGFVTISPEQMQFSFTTDDSDGQLNDAMSMMFTEQTKELT